MSVAFGIPCTDGVVIGVDLQYTKDVVKTAGPKLFPLYKFYDGKTYSVLIAGVGNSISAKRSSSFLTNRRRVNSRLLISSPLLKAFC